MTHETPVPLYDYLNSLGAAHLRARFAGWLRACEREGLPPHPMKLKQWQRRLAAPAETSWSLSGSTAWLVRSVAECADANGRRLLVLSTSGGTVWVRFGRLGLEARSRYAAP